MKLIACFVIPVALIFIAHLSFAKPASEGRQGGQMPKANTEGIKNKFLDIAYAQKSPAQKLDIYLPNEGNGHCLDSWGCL